MFSVLVYVAYALILVAGFGLARIYGHAITAREGMLWGIAGFASFQLAPAMGLAPELPGTLATLAGASGLFMMLSLATTLSGMPIRILAVVLAVIGALLAALGAGLSVFWFGRVV